MGLTISLCYALPSMAGLSPRSAGWWMGILLQISPSSRLWITPFLQMTPSPSAASSAFPPTCRRRTTWPVWLNTGPSHSPRSPQLGWKPTVRASELLCFYVPVARWWHIVLHYHSYVCNHASWLSILQHNNFLLLSFYAACSFSLCSTCTVTDHKSRCTVLCIHVGMRSSIEAEYMEAKMKQRPSN